MVTTVDFMHVYTAVNNSGLSMPNEEAKVLDDYCKRKNVLKPDLFDRQ